MSRVIFTIKYEIIPEKRDEYLKVMRELKNIIKADGLEEYVVYNNVKKENVFEEKYFFIDEKAYEDFDDVEDERVEILMNKLAEMVKNKTTEYAVIKEINSDI